MGRTGTLITIDVELQRAMKESVVDPFNFVTKLREQRNHMVQTEVCIYLYIEFGIYVTKNKCISSIWSNNSNMFSLLG